MANARDARRRKKAQKKKTKDKVRKDKAAKVRGRQRSVARADLGEMSQWPVSNCYIGASWHERGCHVRAVLTRYHEHGRLAAAYFEIDLEEQGVIDAWHRADWQSGEFEDFIGSLGEHVEPMEMCEPGLIKKLVDTAEPMTEDFPQGWAQALAMIWDVDPEGPAFVTGAEPTEDTERPSVGFWGGLKKSLGFKG